LTALFCKNLHFFHASLCRVWFNRIKSVADDANPFRYGVQIRQLVIVIQGVKLFPFWQVPLLALLRMFSRMVFEEQYTGITQLLWEPLLQNINNAIAGINVRMGYNSNLMK